MTTTTPPATTTTTVAPLPVIAAAVEPTTTTQAPELRPATTATVITQTPQQVTTTAAPPPPPPPTTAAPVVDLGGGFACIRQDESGGNYGIDTGNGYYGAYQFAPGTWDNAVSGAGYPQYANGRADLAPSGVQDAAALWLATNVGWSQWSTAGGCGLYGRA